MEDGGYYAIKGFEFQIDKTILLLLESSDGDNYVNIEQIQDIDSSDFVMQVKYKETQKFTPSKVKVPIIQLLNEYVSYPKKTHYLYCYFNDLNGYEHIVNEDKMISVEGLDRILGNKKDSFSESDKADFVKNFRLVFSPDFQEQFMKVISILKSLSFVGNSDDEAIFYYANIATFLRKLVVESSRTSDRKCTKNQLLDYLKSGQKLVFNTSFKEYKGEAEYLKFIKQNVPKPARDRDNFIFIGKLKVDPTVSLGKMIIDILDKYYTRARRDIKPITFILEDESVLPVKEALLLADLNFNDGYESIIFNKSLFSQRPIKNVRALPNRRSSESLSKISFKVRLLSLSTFKSIEEHSLIPQMIYSFDGAENDEFPSASFIRINGLTTKQIINALQLNY
jgi:hypothetical protein